MQTITESPDLLDRDADSESDFPTVPRSRWTWLRRLCMWVMTLLVVLLGAALLILSLASVEPKFYRSAALANPEQRQQQRRLGNEMESKILDLYNAAVSAEAWSVSFSEEQLNGWLAWDFERKFPKLLPPELEDPRVKIVDQKITIAFRCNSPPFRGVGIIEGEIFLTEVLNQVGIRFHSVRSGMLPIPLALFTEPITEHAAKAGVNIEWINDQGNPAMIIDLPAEMLRPAGNYVELKSIDVHDQSIFIAGVTHLEDF